MIERRAGDAPLVPFFSSESQNERRSSWQQSCPGDSDAEASRKVGLHIPWWPLQRSGFLIGTKFHDAGAFRICSHAGAWEL